MDINLIIGQKIRELRIINGLTLNEVSKHLGVSYQQVQKYETGRDKISIDKLIILQKLFCVDWNEIMGNTAKLQSGSPKKLRQVLQLVKSFDAIKSNKAKKKIASFIKALSEVK